MGQKIIYKDEVLLELPFDGVLDFLEEEYIGYITAIDDNFFLDKEPYHIFQYRLIRDQKLFGICFEMCDRVDNTMFLVVWKSELAMKNDVLRLMNV